MKEKVIQKIKSRFTSYDDLAKDLHDDILAANIDAPKNKTLRDHLWCVIGARESFTTALKEGKWIGFSCSLTKLDPPEIAEKLKSSAYSFDQIISEIDDWTDERIDLLLSLLEHEVMHEGQIIRHMYALNQVLPDSWKWA